MVEAEEMKSVASTKIRLAHLEATSTSSLSGMARILDYIETRSATQSAKKIAADLGIPDYEVRHFNRIIRKLCDEGRTLLEDDLISTGHARALIQLPKAQQEEALRLIFKSRRLTVRETVKLVKDIALGRKPQKVADREYYELLSERLSEKVGHPISVKPLVSGSNKGTLTISYSGFDDFDALLSNVLNVNLPDLDL